MNDEILPTQPPPPPEGPPPIPPRVDADAGGDAYSQAGPAPGPPPPPPSFGDGGPGGWGPPDPGVSGNPWERRRQLGFFRGFFETIKIFIRSPKSAFQATLRKGDLWSPFLFAILISWPAFIIEQTWRLVFQSSYLAFVPEELQERLGITSLDELGTTVFGLVVGVFALPFLVALGILVGGVIFHAFLMLLGALDKSDAGLEGTIRATAYAAVGDVAILFPVCGSAISIVWVIVLQIIGISVIHRTSTGKAAVAVIAPAMICCACVILGLAALVALGVNLLGD